MRDRLVICNTSPLLYLHQVGHLDLLPRMYRQVRIPLAVQRELQAGAQRGVNVPDTSAMEWLRVTPLTDTTLLPVVIDLGPGEAEAIALAVAHPGSLLILDDSLGRRIAHLNRVTYTGTLGVLLKAKTEGLLTSVAPVIDALRNTTMHLTEPLIGMVLKEAGEA
jgi:predicted nucleic acid-binding protein